MSADNIVAFAKCATGQKRKDLALRLTQYLLSQNTDQHAFPVNLNGAWGTGKTFFVENWKQLVTDQGHIAIKIDAWESDYLNDPLTIVIAEIIDQLSNICTSLGFFEQEKRILHTVSQLKGSLPKILTSLLGRLVGEEGSKELMQVLESGLGAALNAKPYTSNLNIGELGLEATKQHIRHKQFTKDFKTEVQKLVELCRGQTDQKVFVFIDELDRCRPTYAIEMLETIKHLFDIPGFIFIFSTDTKQLQHSIKAVYGQDFDSHEYLSRFFEQKLTLPEPNYLEFLTAEKVFETTNFKPLLSLPEIATPHELRVAVSIICESNKNQLSLRRVKQICMQLEVVLQTQELQKRYYSIFELIGLVIGRALYVGRPDLGKRNDFEKAVLAIREPIQGLPINVRNLMAANIGKSRSRPTSQGLKLFEFINTLGGYLRNKDWRAISDLSDGASIELRINALKQLKLDVPQIRNQLEVIEQHGSDAPFSGSELFAIIEGASLELDGE